MKHAYLICAHNQFELLEKMLMLLDDANNDIYVHIDKKSKEFDRSRLERVVQKSKLVFTRQINVMWGDWTQIEAELILLGEATKTYHDYYHMLTGQDLPIKSNEEIESFFAKNYGKEFVDFDNETPQECYLDRLSRYYIQHSVNKTLNVFINKFQLIFSKLQVVLHVNRLKRCGITIKKGSVYFDITHEFAKFVVNRMNHDVKYKKMFRYTTCADEVFVQTILFHSPFYKNHSNFQTRYIDWSGHGNNPKVLTMEDYEELIKSTALFARKFSLIQDSQIIEQICSTVNQ